MSLKRVLKYFNIAVLVVVALGLFAVYWYGWRPLPRTSGTLPAGVEARLTIDRDELGVPHISAASLPDLFFAQGYATAQDRLWQMDALRRTAAGRLSEVFGPAALESDREARMLRLERIAETNAAALLPPEREILAAYARGVNAFIEANRGSLPVEFTLAGYSPGPWRIADSLLIGMQMYRELSTTWRAKLQKSELLAGGDRAKIDFLFSPRAGAGVQPGSNAWVLAGARTASGKPLLSNDPHLEYSLPGIWHMVHLRAPGLNVAGVALPGMPCVIIGHNDRIGWGVTNLHFNVQDLYVEKIDPQSGRYIFKGALEQAALDRIRIGVRGGTPVESAQWVTRHGPVFPAGGRMLALRWTAAEPEGFSFPFLDLDRARNWQEFTTALSRYGGPAQNFVYADVDGNIGYHAAGRLPIRRNFDGDLPVDGSSGENEWDGFIPFEQLPQTYNPSSGLIVTANQNPFPAGFPYRISGNFTAPIRFAQIRTLLSNKNGWRTDDMLAVQKDVYSSLCRELAIQTVAAYKRRGVSSPELAGAVDALASWNGQMEQGPAPVIAMLIYEQLRLAIAERAAPGKGLIYDPPSHVGADSIQAAPEAIEILLRTRPADWFADYDQLLLRVFLDAIEQGRRLHGRNIAKWDWAQQNQLRVANPVVSQVPLIGRYFNIGPVPQSGSPTSVKQTTRRLGPSMRMTLDFADLDRSLLNLLAGESGHPLSSHYKDQWSAWYYGHSFPMEFRRVEAKDTLVLEPGR